MSKIKLGALVFLLLPIFGEAYAGFFDDALKGLKNIEEVKKLKESSEELEKVKKQLAEPDENKNTEATKARSHVSESDNSPATQSTRSISELKDCPPLDVNSCRSTEKTIGMPLNFKNGKGAGSDQIFIVKRGLLQCIPRTCPNVSKILDKADYYKDDELLQKLAKNPEHNTTSNAPKNNALVKSTQQELKRLGYSVTVDGITGNQTRNAIARYQRAIGIPITGRVTPDLLARLKATESLAQSTGATGGGNNPKRLSRAETTAFLEQQAAKPGTTFCFNISRYLINNRKAPLQMAGVLITDEGELLGDYPVSCCGDRRVQNFIARGALSECDNYPPNKGAASIAKETNSGDGSINQVVSSLLSNPSFGVGLSFGEISKVIEEAGARRSINVFSFKVGEDNLSVSVSCLESGRCRNSTDKVIHVGIVAHHRKLPYSKPDMNWIMQNRLSVDTKCPPSGKEFGDSNNVRCFWESIPSSQRFGQVGLRGNLRTYQVDLRLPGRN